MDGFVFNDTARFRLSLAEGLGAAIRDSIPSQRIREISRLICNEVAARQGSLEKDLEVRWLRRRFGADQEF